MAKSFSNRYIFLYSAALVTVTALLLSVVSVGLKPRQERNREAEKQQMILKAKGMDVSRDKAAEIYAQQISDAMTEDGLPYYTYKGGKVIPLQGNGLWGPIWGYMALDSNSTVAGVVFDHQGETPGLGGEMATDKFAARFVGKKMDCNPIRLKKNADHSSPYEVDAISGGTMTSNGVTEMLEAAYDNYIRAERKEDDR